MEIWFREYPQCEGFISILLTNDAEIKQLNAEHRGISTSTDVLTFESGFKDSPILGDIAISLDTAARQAKIHGHSLSQESAILTLHGALHLAGLNDETEPEYIEMMAEMARICMIAGVPLSKNWSTKMEAKRA